MKINFEHMHMLCTVLVCLSITQSASIPINKKCLLNNIKTQEDFDVKKFTGNWFEIAYIHHHGDDIMSASSHYDITKEGKLRVEYGGTIAGKCIPPLLSVSTLPSHGSAKMTFTSGTSWVISTDYDNYALLYGCRKFNSLDDQCPEGQESVTILSRNSQMSAETMATLQHTVEKELCIDPQSLLPVTHEITCPPHTPTEAKSAEESADESFTEETVEPGKNVTANPKVEESDNVATTSAPKENPVQLPKVEMYVEQKSKEIQEESQESAEENNTDFEGVQSQEDFDAVKFAGIWYHAYRLKWSHHKFESEVNRVKLQEDGTFKVLSRHYHDGHCSDSDTVVYTQSKEHKGDWSFDVYGGLKVFYTSYNYAVLYICNHVEQDGHCKHEHLEVEILSRTNDALPSDAVKKMLEVVKAIGLSKEDFEGLDNTVTCDITDKSCKVSDYTAHQDLDLQKFSGLWYEVERTRYSERNSWESGVAKYVVKEGNALQFSYAGTRSGKCQGPFYGYGKPAGDASGEFNMYIGGEEMYYSPWSVYFPYKVLYTDYNVAITYACMFLNNDGSCRRPGEQVDILSRTPEINSETSLRLHNIVAEKLCVDASALVKSVREDNCHVLVGATDCSSRPMCMTECEAGFVKDNDGCDTCTCVDTESQIESSGESLDKVEVESGDGDENAEISESKADEQIIEKNEEAEVSNEQIADLDGSEVDAEVQSEADAEDESEADPTDEREIDTDESEADPDESEAYAAEESVADAEDESALQSDIEEAAAARGKNPNDSLICNSTLFKWFKFNCN